MQEFKIEGNHLKYRMLSWSIVILLMLVAVFMLALVFSGKVSGSVASWIGTPALVGGLLGAYISALREALNYARRQMVFVMDEGQIVRRRKGHPEAKIAFSEIAGLNEGAGCLIVTSSAPLRKIAIPKSVGGYDLIRTELAKYHAISTSSQRFPLKSIWFPVISVLSWVAVVSFHDLRLVALFAVIALVLLAITSYHVWGIFRRIQKRSLALLSLGSAWVAAFVLIYERVMHP